jgi:hypothetical protein
VSPSIGRRGVEEKKNNKGRRDATKGVALGQALGPSSAPSRGCGGGSMKSKATRILTDT